MWDKTPNHDYGIIYQPQKLIVESKRQNNYKALMKKHHPDLGGDVGLAQKLGEAINVLQDIILRISVHLNDLKINLKPLEFIHG